MRLKIGKMLLAAGIGISIFASVGHSVASIGRVSSQAGEVTSDSVVLWGRCNVERDSLLTFSLTTRRNLLSDPGKNKNVVRKKSHNVSDESDFTGSLIFKGLKAGTQYYYQADCKSLAGKAGSGTGMVATFQTAASPTQNEAVSFVWAADLAGQGWGRNPDLTITHVDGELIKGGYVVFDSMSKLNPDFALFQGDMIYADGAIPAQKEIPGDVGGGVWINNPDKDFTAITLDDFRANWKYNLNDEKMVRFLAKTPVYIQWDDHEVTNNWYPGEILPAGAPYFGLSADVLAANARQAWFEYNPIGGGELYRSVRHGKHLELFMLDERSYRGANPDNFDPNGIEMLGQKQLSWLKKALANSQATWKIISTHDPLGIVTGDVTDRDAWGQGDPAVLGREVQLAEILKFIKDNAIRNVVFLTSDVHFTAAISYDPAVATFTDFDPFWEFVVGPIHAGAFGAGELDASFGPQYVYLRAPSTEGIGQNSPPPHLQSFGLVEITREGELTIKLIDITGAILFKKTMLPM